MTRVEANATAEIRLRSIELDAIEVNRMARVNLTA